MPPFNLAPKDGSSNPGPKTWAVDSLSGRIGRVFEIHRLLGIGNFLFGLIVVSMLTTQVAFSAKILFLAALGLGGGLRFALFGLYRSREGRSSAPGFGWAAVGINALTGLTWVWLFGKIYASPVSWDLLVGVLGIGLTSFPAVLMGVWLPAALAYPLATSLGVSLVLALHWSDQAPGLLALFWMGFLFAGILAYQISRSSMADFELRQRLSAKETMFRQMAETIPIPCAVMKRAGGHLLFANARLCGLLGLRSDELPRRSIWEIVARREDRQSLMDEMSAHGRIEDRETMLAPKAGSHLVALLSLMPLEIDGDGLLMLTLKDVTQDKELQKAQVSARLAAEQALATERRAVEEQRHFLAMVAHEFRTPLSIISTTMDVLDMTSINARPEVTQAYERIRRATERLVRLIETCLNEDRLVDIGTLSREPLDLTQIMRTIIRDSRGGTNAARIEAAIPEQPITIVGDKALIKIALANLIDNAEKYTKADGKITARLTPYGDLAVIQVSDTGIGIPDSELPRIFDKYYRAPGAKGIAGAGLGLNLVKRIIELHGGGIEAASMHGQGSTFTVRLPLATPAPEPS